MKETVGTKFNNYIKRQTPKPQTKSNLQAQHKQAHMYKLVNPSNQSLLLPTKLTPTTRPSSRNLIY